MGKSSIEWTEKTWNPVRGCTKVSPGCKHCYAETFAERWRGVKGHAYEQGFDLRLVPHKLDEPLHWKKPSMVFVNSMSDLFHEDVPDQYIASVFETMARAHWHTFQILTKRADRLPRWFQWMRSCIDIGHATPAIAKMSWPLPNVWMGVSVENRRERRRIEHLERTPAAVRFLSCEPLLEDLGDLQLRSFGPAPGGMGEFEYAPKIGWVIVGGESGAGARPMALQWARDIVEQCRAAGVKVFVKQLGARPIENVDGDVIEWRFKDAKAGDPATWPEDLRVREFPR